MMPHQEFHSSTLRETGPRQMKVVKEVFKTDTPTLMRLRQADLSKPAPVARPTTSGFDRFLEMQTRYDSIQQRTGHYKEQEKQKLIDKYKDTPFTLRNYKEINIKSQYIPKEYVVQIAVNQKYGK